MASVSGSVDCVDGDFRCLAFTLITLGNKIYFC
jgi:hypothetical protein